MFLTSGLMNKYIINKEIWLNVFKIRSTYNAYEEKNMIPLHTSLRGLF